MLLLRTEQDTQQGVIEAVESPGRHQPVMLRLDRAQAALFGPLQKINRPALCKHNGTQLSCCYRCPDSDSSP